MKRGLRIGLRLFGIGTFDIRKPGNVQGDEAVARGWAKYLSRRPDVESVHLYGPCAPIREPLDVLIHFHPDLELPPKVKNILYLQNAFPKEQYPGGTVGVFHRVRSRFDGYLFTSRTLMEACAPGGVIPFGTDPEIFYPQPSSDYRHAVVFVGNDIRGPSINHRYLVPALPFGLIIYGNNTWAPPLASAGRGKLPMEDLPKVYSSASVNLNAHIDEHITWDTINLRIYDTLACEGFILSDPIPSLRESFEEAVVTTTGDEDEWAKLVRYLADPTARCRYGQTGRQIVLSQHTYANRAEAIVAYLREEL